MPLLLVAACTLAALWAQPEISRPVRSWEFVDATGPKAGLFGNEEGNLEAFVYPLKILRDFRLVFHSADREIPAGSIARRIVSRPGSYTIVYSADDFRVSEELCVPRDVSGALIRLRIEARNPVRVDFRFTRDFQLMWPAAFGSAYGEWDAANGVYRMGADGQTYAAVVGAAGAMPVALEYATNYSSSTETAFTIGTIQGHAERTIAIAASLKSREEALAAWRDLTARPAELIDQTDRYYRDYLGRTVAMRLPDPALQQAYDWSRISLVKCMVDNPLLGEGLVAGYGPSKGGYRPGFAWFFGRDSFWTSLALSSTGDFENARRAIAFVAKFQREDGKIPHEISQSASLTPWFRDFPYGYNAADSTPLYLAAVRDYVASSGDVDFAREQAPRLWKALDFMRSTFDSTGFPRNLNVGPGWVEGGPLLPVRLELYQAACYVESLRSLAWLARVLNEPARGQALEAEAGAKQQAMEQMFWRPAANTYAFGIDPAGNPVDEPSVLATVPMWFGLLDAVHASAMIDTLAREDHAADWGMRIISSRSKIYDPSGYHFGSVWPLFTGWASVGEYRYHREQPAFANLLANAELALMAGGNTTEVLSGSTATPLSTASPHQTWSAAMVISPLLRGLAGLEVDAIAGRVQFAPHLPADWNSIGIAGVPTPAGKLDLDLARDAATLTLNIANSGTQSVAFEFAPAYPPGSQVTAAEVDGASVHWDTEPHRDDWHPRIRLDAHAGTTRLVLRHSGFFGYTVVRTPIGLAEPSSNLKVISENWTESPRSLRLSLSGLAYATYRLHITGVDRVVSVTGARREGADGVVVEMPAGTAGEYVSREVTFGLKWGDRFAAPLFGPSCWRRYHFGRRRLRRRASPSGNTSRKPGAR
jgi:glycogen debranching enzyme